MSASLTILGKREDGTLALMCYQAHQWKTREDINV